MGGEVRNNTVKADIAFISGDVGWQGGSSVVIENNGTEEHPCVARHVGFSVPNLKGKEIELLGGPATNPGIDITITGNHMHMDPSGSIDVFHYPIAAMYGQDAVFFAVFDWFDNGIPFQSMKGAMVSGNVFTGYAHHGLFLGDFLGSPNDAYGNNFSGNDYSQLNTDEFPIYLGRHTKNNWIRESLFLEGNQCDNILDETMLVTPMGKNRYMPPWQKTCKTAMYNAKAIVDQIHADHEQKMQELLEVLETRTGKAFPNWPFKP
jgi:hypothetical protein